MNFKSIFLLPSVFLIIGISACNQPTAQPIISNSLPNDPSVLDRPYVILVSIDGFRYDYLQIHKAPNISKIARKGVRAEYMEPCFPSSTFPNHYSIAPGMYPARHGIVTNEFIDRKKGKLFKVGDRPLVDSGFWYGGVPIWSLAEQQGMRSASYFWVGSESEIAGFRPAQYMVYDHHIPNMQRVHQVIRWLNMPLTYRPHLITLYFALVDDHGHKFGPKSKETGKAVAEIDRAIGMLYQEVRKMNLPVNIVLTSDHGMVRVRNEEAILLDTVVDLFGYQAVQSSGTINLLYAHDPDSQQIEKTYQELKSKEGNRFRVYKNNELPERLHFKDNPRIGELVVHALAPYVFGEKPEPGEEYEMPSKGKHGYVPHLTPEVNAIFYAWGPNFKSKKEIPAFRNIHVYPMLAKLLGLEIEPGAIDGNVEVLEGILRDGNGNEGNSILH